jgi:hypothetical protein
MLSAPRITSNFWFGSFSYKRTSKFCAELTAKESTACHSMLKMRLGAVPETEVKTPQPFAQVEHAKPASVRISCQRGKMV